MTKHSFKAFLEDYSQSKLQDELRSDWGSVVFYRLPAFALARIAIACSVGAMALTYLGIVLIALIATLAWMLPPQTALPWMIAASIAFNILDCADGPLARATNTTSRTGAYLDFASDVFYRNVMLASVGLVADRLAPGATFPWLAVGLICGSLTTYARLNRSYIQKHMNVQSIAAKPSRGTADLIYNFLSGLDTLLPILTLLAWMLGFLEILLIWLLLYTSIDAAIAVIQNYRLLSKQDILK